MAATKTPAKTFERFAYLDARGRSEDPDTYIATFCDQEFCPVLANWDGPWHDMFASPQDAQAFLQDLRNCALPINWPICYVVFKGSAAFQRINEELAADLDALRDPLAYFWRQDARTIQ